MKKMLFLASAALALLASCSTEEKPEDKSSFGLSPVICNVEPAGGIVELKITGKESWTVELTEWSTENTDWCKTEVARARTRRGDFVGFAGVYEYARVHEGLGGVRRKLHGVFEHFGRAFARIAPFSCARSEFVCDVAARKRRGAERRNAVE